MDIIQWFSSVSYTKPACFWASPAVCQFSQNESKFKITFIVDPVQNTGSEQVRAVQKGKRYVWGDVGTVLPLHIWHTVWPDIRNFLIDVLVLMKQSWRNICLFICQMLCCVHEVVANFVRLPFGAEQAVRSAFITCPMLKRSVELRGAAWCEGCLCVSHYKQPLSHNTVFSPIVYVWMLISAALMFIM